MEEVFDVLECTVISEQASGASALVPLTQEQIQEVAGEDADPKFATYIIEGGWSKSKRYYGPDVMDLISEQINNSADPVVGYMGHISPERDPFDFPDINYRWVRAKLQASGEKVKVLAKAYLLPGSKAREYAERRIKVPISIRAQANMRPIKGGVQVLREGFELESIDGARPRKAGMGGRLVAVTSEMEGRKEVDGKDIAALSEDELRTHNPLLVKEIEEKATKPLTTKISEMEGEQDEAKENVTLISKLRELLGIKDDADVLEVVGTTLKELKANTVKVREGILDAVLEKRFKNEKERGLVRRVLATEMADNEFPDGNDDATKLKITEMVNEAIDNDEMLKGLATEMESGGGTDAGGGQPEPRKENSKTREIKPGYENDRIKVRAAR